MQLIMTFEERVEDLGTIEGWKRSYQVLTRAGQAALESVLRGMRHPHWRVRMWCADFMDHFADQRCTRPLIAAIADPVADVRRHAVHSIGCQGCKAEALRIDVVPLLIDKALHDPSLRVRQVAAHLLGNQGADERIVSALSEAIELEHGAKFKSNSRWAIQRASASGDSIAA